MFENGFLIRGHRSSCLWVGARFTFYIGFFLETFGCQKNLKSTEHGDKNPQPETIDRRKLQQSMCEIYETD